MSISNDAWTPPEMDEDEDYVEYLGRAADYYCDNPAPAGEYLVLVECDATPRHWPTYEVKTDDFYPAPCGYCVADAYRKQLAERERRMHWLDHPIRGRLAATVCSWAYGMGIIAGYGISGGGPKPCRRCITGIRFKGRRHYVLGREQDRYARPGKVRGWIIARRLGLRCLVCNRRAGYGGVCPNADHNG